MSKIVAYNSALPSLEAFRKRGMSRKDFNEIADQIVGNREKAIRQLMDSLDPGVRDLVRDVLIDMRESADFSQSHAYRAIWEMDFKWKPATIEQYVEDEYYLGKMTKTLFPTWRRHLYEIFAPGARVTEWLMGGSIGSGKSYAGALGLSFCTYVLSCLKNPQRFCNLAEGSPIVFGMYSVTKAQAADVGYDYLRTFVDESPYFREKFDFNRRLLQRISFKEARIEIRVGSREMHAIGANLLGLIMDEANFMQAASAKKKEADAEAEGQAEKLYNATQSRIKSRFVHMTGLIPMMTILISSEQGQDSFLRRREKEAAADIEQKRVVVSRHSVWGVRDKRLFKKPKFYVEIGDRIHPSRMLRAKSIKQARKQARPDARVIAVPGEYLRPFQTDVDKAVRDLAGIATFGISPLLRDRTVIEKCANATWRHPFTRMEFSISNMDNVLPQNYFLDDHMFKIVYSKPVPIMSPRIPRFAHADIGLTTDSFGLAIGHVMGLKNVKRVRPDGVPYETTEPVIGIDLMLRIRPPKEGEIDIAKVRDFICYLRDNGLPITHFSADSTYGRDSCQIMASRGFTSRPVSVDKSDAPYLSLRQALMEGRLSYYKYPTFFREVLGLERDIDSGRVDHPRKFEDGTPGSKDCADAVAAVVHEIMNQPLALKTTDGIPINLMNEPSLAVKPQKTYDVDKKIDWKAIDDDIDSRR